MVAHTPTSAAPSTSIPGAAKPVEPARAASTFKLVGTVKAANSADSFALVRRTADSQLVKLRAGDRIEGLTVSAIESDSVVLAGVAHSIVIEADKAAPAPALPAPSPVVSRPSVADVEPAWAGDPAPFGH